MTTEDEKKAEDIEITPEMIEAGEKVVRHWFFDDQWQFHNQIAHEIFAAMIRSQSPSATVAGDRGLSAK